jgi:hypothetical protein
MSDSQRSSLPHRCLIRIRARLPPCPGPIARDPATRPLGPAPTPPFPPSPPSFAASSPRGTIHLRVRSADALKSRLRSYAPKPRPSLSSGFIRHFPHRRPQPVTSAVRLAASFCPFSGGASPSSFGRHPAIVSSFVHTEAPAIPVPWVRSAVSAPAPLTRPFPSSFGRLLPEGFPRQPPHPVRSAGAPQPWVRAYTANPRPSLSFGFVRHFLQGGPQPGPSGVRSADSPLSRILLDAPELRPSFLPEFVRHDSRADPRQSVPEFVRQAPHRLRFAWTRRDPGPSHSSLRASRTLSDRIERTTL